METASDEGEREAKIDDDGIGGSLTPDYRDKEVSVAASPRTTGIKRYRWQTHPGLQG